MSPHLFTGEGMDEMELDEAELSINLSLLHVSQVVQWCAKK